MIDVAEAEKGQRQSSTDAPKSEPNINYSDIATKLLSDRLLLTALELHCELTESGREIPKLKEFFSNPGNFEQNSRIEISPTGLTRWSSQATLDSLDMTRYSEDGEKVIDDRVAVLEFELRKAKETINALRTNLTVATECETINQDVNTSATSNTEPIKPHEQRALNFLINEYLLMHGYKLTSNTFADENENQDFEVWDDVGLNIPKPPELLHLYRESMKNSHILNTTYENAYSQTDGDAEEVELLISQLDQLKEHISELEQENEQLTINFEKLKEEKPEGVVETVPLETVNSHFAATTSDSGSIPDHFIIVGSYPISNSDNTDTVDDISSPKLSEQLPSLHKSKSMEVIENIESDESTCHSNEWLKLSESDSETKIDCKNDILRLLNKNYDRQLPIGFQKEIFTRCYIEAGHIPGAVLLNEQIMESEIVLDRFVHIIAGTLHKITPTIPPNNREDLILLIIYTIQHHPVASIREKLIQLLFGLKKKPKDEERKAILSGIVWLARNSDSSILENEFLPICWEELNQKYAERRLLVSELCCSLTPYLSITARNSLLMSLLQQILLDDKEDRVRMSAINSIAFIVTFIDDDNKYTQSEELLFTGLQDTSANVVEMTTITLLPVLTKWAFDIDKLQSHLISRLLRVLDTQLKSTINQYKDGSGSPFKHSLPWETRCGWTISALRSILPYIVMHVASASAVLQSIHPNLPSALPRSAFSQVCKGLCNPATFYEGKYSLGEIIRAFDAVVNEKSWSQMEWLTNVFITKLLDIVSQVNVSWEELTNSIVAMFYSMCAGFGKTAIDAKVKCIFLERLKNIETELTKVNAEWPNLTVLPIYILAVLVPLQETEDIQSTLRRFLFMLPLCGCPITVLEYCVKELSKINFTQDLLLTTLWEGVVHAREVVRLTVVKLFSLIIPHSADFTIVNRIIPAIVTLSNDSDPLVKTATVRVFGKLIKETSIKEVTDKCCFQFQTFLSEQNLFENHAHIVQLITTLGEIASHVDSAFREDVLVPQLAASAAYTMQLSNQSRKQELSRVLLDAFSSVIYCSFTKNTISTALVPGLKCLESVCGDSLAHREAITSMIKEVEMRTYGQESVTSPTISSVTANVGQEVKQRVSKIFQTPISKQGKFWKK